MCLVFISSGDGDEIQGHRSMLGFFSSIQNAGIVLEEQYIVIPTLHYGGATQSGHLTADRILEVHT